jgi:hypothetical protein
MDTPRWLIKPLAVRNSPARAPAKTPPSGDLWQRMYDAALTSGHPQPEKMADTMLRSRETALRLKEARPRTLVTAEPPKPQETVVTSKTKARAVLADCHRCKALTLEGRRCGFKATRGEFCSKHAVKNI